MKLALKTCPTFDQTGLAIMEELSFHTTKLYNIANHRCREEGFVSYKLLEKELKPNWHRAWLHSHTYQQCLRTLEQDWKSFFRANEEYRRNPSKFQGQPRPPGYKHMEKRNNEIIFTAYAIRRRDHEWWLSLSKSMRHQFRVDCLKVEVSEKLPLPEEAKIQQVRLQFDQVQRSWEMLILYEVVPPEPKKDPHIMSIDLGLDNLATVTFTHCSNAYIICGRTLKSKNSYYNRKIAQAQSVRMKQTGSERFRNTHRIRRWRKKQKDYIHNALHQASRTLIQLAAKHQAGTIVVGKLTGIKQHSRLKTFVQIPVARLVDMMSYKAELDGRIVIQQDERYTSGVSAYDLEPINKAHYNNTRRIKRGLFRTNEGLMVNADVNGSLNILRKAIKEGIPYPIQQVRDNGCVNHPQRIRVS